MAQCSLIELGSGCFRAVLASKASLKVFNTTLGGKVWADEARPGLFEEEGRLSHTTPLRTSLPLRLTAHLLVASGCYFQYKRTQSWLRFHLSHREPSPAQTAVTAEVDRKSAHTASVWEALSQELAANASDVIEALEFCCNATGAACRRSRTGRQRLGICACTPRDRVLTSCRGKKARIRVVLPALWTVLIADSLPGDTCKPRFPVKQRQTGMC